MKIYGGSDLRVGLAFFLTLALYGCGGGGSTAVTPPGPTPTQAEQSDIVVGTTTAGITPFIASVQLSGKSTSQLKSVSYTIAPKPQTVSAALKATWTLTALSNRGYVKTGAINLPVAGLYENYSNAVSYVLTFSDGSTQSLKNSITTAAFTDPTGIFMSPTIVKARAAGSTLGYNFFYIKSSISSPVIVDTDAQVRWMTTGTTLVQAQYFGDGEFITGDSGSPVVYLIQLDGTQTTLAANLPQPLLGSFTHNIDPGPNGLLAEFSGMDDLGNSSADIVAEISPLTTDPPDQTYDMADILSKYMTKNGDNASTFVRPGLDWFHLNAVTYDPSDKSVIVSSRENFLIKLDYATHDIIWIFGDPTKYWYTFPSLKAKALTLVGGGLYPMGQHGTSITSDGDLMIFNDGFGSLNQPGGEPAGESIGYSAVTAYTIDAKAMTAKVAWNFDDGKQALSQVCGSSYEAGGSYLVDYSTAWGWTQAWLLGLDSNKNVVFNFQYQSPETCGTAWNAIPVPFEDLQITK